MKNVSLKDYKLSLGKKLGEIRDNHKIWSNPLLKACGTGQLSKTDFQFLFSQYYLYSKNFTKLLTIGMFKCDSDYYRSKLSENLWEEGGGQDIELRHAEIFRRFLTDNLHITLNDIQFEPYTELFFKRYSDLCFNSEPFESAAILSFGTEGIVSRLYSIFKHGLLSAGVTEDELKFFNIHIECDDEHALALEEMALSYKQEDHWLERCGKVVSKALDLRDEFFTNIYHSLQSHRFENLLKNITRPTTQQYKKLNRSSYITSVNNVGNILYENNNIQENINFRVERVGFNSEILDPRIVYIPTDSHNELHSHAHESIFLILSGEGKVTIGEDIYPVKTGDLIYVPRWIAHQTHNTGNRILKFFAITDYGFTGRLSENQDSTYRQK